jgi:di/tripeptidase
MQGARKMSNLDAIINEVGFEIAKILDENLINKLLGVLANDGVYAMWVYAINKVDENILLKILLQLKNFPIQIKDENNNFVKLDNIQEQLELFNNIIELNEKIKNLKKELRLSKDNERKKEELNKQEKILNSTKEKYKKLFQKNYDFFKILSTDINQLLFFKELLEKALIYARYHAKAMKDE